MRASLSAVAVLMAALSCHADTAGGTKSPMLVSILVEGLESDCLELLLGSMPPDGFNRLIADGAYAPALSYGKAEEAASGAAILATGTWPVVNGIAGSAVYDAAKGVSTPVLQDPTALGNFTSSTLSPAALKVATLADELRMASSGEARVWSVGAKPDEAIIMAGHAGSTALWIDAETGRWATTTYYKDVPRSLSRRNYSGPLSARLDTMRWEPSAVTGSIERIARPKRQYPFSYTFPKKDPDRISKFLASPRANTEVTDMALALLEEYGATDAGTDLGDMLSVTYNVASYPYSRTADQHHELYDAYIKLDREIARLLNAVDSRSGKGRSIVMVAGIPTAQGEKAPDAQWRIPGGTFSPKKATGLLNMYLMALYGSGDWVKGYANRQFHLNRDLIESRKIDASVIRAEAASFLEKMSGIVRAFTLENVMADPEARDFVVATQAGDIFVEITPGWEVESSGNPAEGSGVQKACAIRTPLLIAAPGVKARKIGGVVDARSVAPTVARLLRIRSPAGASQPPLEL